MMKTRGIPEPGLLPVPMAVAITLLQAVSWSALASGFLVTAAAADPPTTAPVAAGPQEVMADLSNRLFAALDKNSAALRHDVNKLRPVIDQLLAPHFDPEYSARLVLGQHWRGATPEQRQQFAAALYQRLLRTYVGAVAEWTADRVKLLPVHSDAAALQVTVHTQVTTSRGAIDPVDYRLRQTPGGWKIFDVIVNGVSYMRNYHDDTDEEIAQKGLDAAIARLASSNPEGAVRTLSPDPQGAR
jgi:phospholipid transport system substrate-binding protein